jgi:hypothetical protein
MANSTIKNTVIHQKTISIGGIAVTKKGYQWYYADPYSITDQLPSGARIIAVNRGSVWDEDCIIDGVTLKNRSSIQISSPRSQTIPSGREVVVMYTID